MFQLPSYEGHLTVGVVVWSCLAIPLAWLHSAHVLKASMFKNFENRSLLFLSWNGR